MKTESSIKSQGFMAISTVMLVSAVVLVIAVTVSLVGVGEGQSSLAIYKGEGNLNLVEGCAEDYLLKIRSNEGFATTAIVPTITRPEGTCNITVTSANPNWNVTISSTDPTYRRRIQLQFTRGINGITLTSWREI